MSTIPPNWLSSIVGSQGAQHASGTRRAKETAEQAEPAGAANFADNLHNTIENSDRDGEVHTDSEGLGSQGRAYQEEPPAEGQPPEAESPATEGGLDVQA